MSADPAPSTAVAAAVTDPDALLREYGQLEIRNREIDAEKRRNNQRQEAIKQRCLDVFADRQSKSISYVGIGNLHLKKKGNAKIIRDDGDYSRDPTPQERDRARRALERSGLQHLLKSNFTLQQVTPLYKEWDQKGEHPPPEMDEAFIFETGWDIGLDTTNS